MLGLFERLSHLVEGLCERAEFIMAGQGHPFAVIARRNMLTRVHHRANRLHDTARGKQADEHGRECGDERAHREDLIDRDVEILLQIRGQRGILFQQRLQPGNIAGERAGRLQLGREIENDNGDQKNHEIRKK